MIYESKKIQSSPYKTALKFEIFKIGRKFENNNNNNKTKKDVFMLFFIL
jgi:hypothetical protein